MHSLLTSLKQHMAQTFSLKKRSGYPRLLLPLALHCLKDRDTERPSADELCGRLATLKPQPRYASSLENSPLQALQQEIETRASELERSKANELELTTRLGECEEELKAKEQTVEQVISDCQAALQVKTAECEKNRSVIQGHESVIEQLRQELLTKQMQLKSKTAECERNQSVVEQLQKELHNKREQPSKYPSSQKVGSKLLSVCLWQVFIL